MQHEDVDSLFELAARPIDTMPKLLTNKDLILDFPPQMPLLVFNILHIYSSLFTTPTTLPPHHPIDHKIHYFLIANQ